MSGAPCSGASSARLVISRLAQLELSNRLSGSRRRIAYLPTWATLTRARSRLTLSVAIEQMNSGYRRRLADCGWMAGSDRSCALP